MDSYREHPGDFDPPSTADVSASEDVTAAIGTDERRMHVRAYNHWVSLLNGRDFPSIEDLEPEAVSDFAGNSVLLDFTCGRDNPAIPYIGGSIRDECGLSEDTRTISDVPSRSLLSRLTDHYMQIIANRAPIGFEAEFANQREETICYRGILMPFSSDGETIDFIYGVINWKRVGAGQIDGEAELPRLEFDAAAGALDSSDAEDPLELTEFVVKEDSEPPGEEPTEPTDYVAKEPGEPVESRFNETSDSLEPAEDDALEPTDPFDLNPAELPPPPEEPVDLGLANEAFQAPHVHFAWEDGPLADVEAGELPNVELDEDAGLADRLWAARETADAVKAVEGRTRTALYRALSLAYDFALAAKDNSEEYAELLEESGVKAQARAPMTPIVKLVFGIDYDKARLTEFAAALAYGLRQEIAVGGFQDFVEKQTGGLKALVAAERQARRPEPRRDTKSEIARERLRTAPAISLADVPAEDEFAVVITRRGADGRHQPVAIVEDEALVERAIRRAVAE